MKEKMKAFRRPLRRLAAMTMTCALAFTLAPGLLTRTKAVELSGDALTTVTYYEWKRVKTKDDLPTGSELTALYPLLIFDKKNKDGTTTPFFMNGDKENIVVEDKEKGYIHFNGVDCSKIPELAGFPDTFVTTYNPTGMTCWRAWKNDDGENGDARVIYLNPSVRLGEAGVFAAYLVDYDQYDYFLHHGSVLVDGAQAPKWWWTLVPANWSVITPDVYLKKYGADDDYKEKVNVDGGRVIMQMNLSGEDAVLDVNGESTEIQLDFWGGLDTYWRMYIGTAKSYDSINTNVTVQKGQMLKLDGDITIGEKGVITVEEGAVLSINGNVFNNGFIYNKGGTILVQSNGCIQSNNPEQTNNYGGIGLDGGDLVIRTGGRVMTGVTKYDDRWGNGLKLRNGASIVNQGTLITSGNVSVNSGSTLENRKGGTMLFGYRMKDTQEGNLHRISASEVKSPDFYETTLHLKKKSLYRLKEGLFNYYVSEKVLKENIRYYFERDVLVFNTFKEEYQDDFRNFATRAYVKNGLELISFYTLDGNARSLALGDRSLIYNYGTIMQSCILTHTSSAQVINQEGSSYTENPDAKTALQLMNGNYVKTDGEVVPKNMVITG